MSATGQGLARGAHCMPGRARWAPFYRTSTGHPTGTGGVLKSATGHVSKWCLRAGH